MIQKISNIIFPTTLILVLVYQVNTFLPERNIDFMLKNQTLSLGQKMRIKQGDSLYLYLQFLKDYLPENATVLLPPTRQPWPETGNKWYMLYFLYPRKLVESNNDGFINENFTHVLISWGEGVSDHYQDYGWPKFKVAAKKIVYMKEENMRPMIVNKDYDPSGSENQDAWGFIEVRK